MGGRERDAISDENASVFHPRPLDSREKHDKAIDNDGTSDLEAH